MRPCPSNLTTSRIARIKFDGEHPQMLFINKLCMDVFPVRRCPPLDYSFDLWHLSTPTAIEMTRPWSTPLFYCILLHLFFGFFLLPICISASSVVNVMFSTSPTNKKYNLLLRKNYIFFFSTGVFDGFKILKLHAALRTQTRLSKEIKLNYSK